MITKQLESVGVACWVRRPSHVGTVPNAAGYFHVQIMAFGTDHGPDQQGADTLMRQSISPDDLFTWRVRQWCMQHQIHLAVKRQLCMCDSMFPAGYFSRLATTVNVWRSGSNPIKLREAWKTCCGPACAEAAAKRLPPRPLRSRWGSVTQTETNLLKAEAVTTAAASSVSHVFDA
eukprot:3980243-Alexandrium_andersonii.AAC.1